MLPPTKTGRSSMRSISATRAVVVVLPLEPVIADDGAGRQLQEEADHGVQGDAALARGLPDAGRSSGTLCETKTASASVTARGVVDPSERLTASPADIAEAVGELVRRLRIGER